MTLEDLSREELIQLVEVYAKNWLAHDGCWFLSIENEYGLDKAIELDTQAWSCFSPVEARRIMQAFNIEANGGLESLEKALTYRLYAAVNRQQADRADADVLRFRMVECRVQQARQRKGLAPFPCKPVGRVEYAEFAHAIDPRIETSCVHAPPDEVTDSFCEWQFKLNGG